MTGKEIISNKTGYLIEHENWLAMADAVEHLVSNKKAKN